VFHFDRQPTAPVAVRFSMKEGRCSMSLAKQQMPSSSKFVLSKFVLALPAVF
jgi:hypothetical protein